MATRQWFGMSTTADPFPSDTVENAIWRQQPIPGGWVCPECVHHAGGIGCDRGVFISFVGANMKGCRGFEPGKPCRHCGMMT